MIVYPYKCVKCEERTEIELDRIPDVMPSAPTHCDQPMIRIFNFALGEVRGAGGSPSRPGKKSD